MGESKSFASLSSGLLARKGGAKPAMRPQGFNQMGVSLEDLGWNDMGHAPQPLAPEQVEEMPEHVPSSIAALTPAPRSSEPEPVYEAPRPVVVEQQRAIEASFAPKEVEAAPAPVKPVAKVLPLPSRQAATAEARARAAFTLRLDAQRHLKLRLACAVTNRSAQKIVTEALDEYLESLPALDALAGQMPAKLGKRK